MTRISALPGRYVPDGGSVDAVSTRGSDAARRARVDHGLAAVHSAVAPITIVQTTVTRLPRYRAYTECDADRAESTDPNSHSSE